MGDAGWDAEKLKGLGNPENVKGWWGAGTMLAPSSQPPVYPLPLHQAAGLWQLSASHFHHPRLWDINGGRGNGDGATMGRGCPRGTCSNAETPLRPSGHGAAPAPPACVLGKLPSEKKKEQRKSRKRFPPLLTYLPRPDAGCCQSSA